MQAPFIICNLHLPTKTFIICHRFSFGLCAELELHHFSSGGKWKHLILLPELCHKLDSTQVALSLAQSPIPSQTRPRPVQFGLNSAQTEAKAKANTLHSCNFNQFILISFEVHINLMDSREGATNGTRRSWRAEGRRTHPHPDHQ